MLHSYVYMAPSRRLGRSLGVDLVPHKTCSFDCIYCQLGRTTRLTVTPQPGPTVDELVRQVSEALARLTTLLEPDRIHLNTVVRPPAEPFTLAATDEDLRSLRELFGPHAEVIAQPALSEVEEPKAVAEDAILDILTRRPCTVGDLSAALGVASSPLVKVLASLLDRGTVQVQVRQRRVFYSVGRGGVQ